MHEELAHTVAHGVETGYARAIDADALVALQQQQRLRVVPVEHAPTHDLPVRQADHVAQVVLGQRRRPGAGQQQCRSDAKTAADSDRADAGVHAGI
ncbi:MAG: hypothetical protein ACK595_21615 [Planctomycetota bacterium]